MTKKIKLNKGFTLLEVMVAITIICVGLVAALSLITFTISQGPSDKNKIIAYNLAQEGIELVRNIRDNNWAKIAQCPPSPPPCSTKWDDNLSGGNEKIAYDNLSIISGGDDKLYLNANGFYNYDSSGSETPFSRKINFSGCEGGASECQRVTCTVSWKERSNDDLSVTIVTNLYNWKPAP